MQLIQKERYIERRVSSKWRDSYTLLKEYCASNNIDSYTFIKRSVIVNGMRVGAWVEKQRMEYQHGKLSNEKIQLLDSINFLWSEDELWKRKFNLLLKFKEIHGHVDVPDLKEMENVKIGKWVALQRTKYKNNKLDSEKIEMLNSIGFKWCIDTASWDFHYDLLKRCFEHNGNSDVSTTLIINDVKLGRWVSGQRKHYKLKSLSKERIEKLNEIDFVWIKKIRTNKFI